MTIRLFRNLSRGFSWKPAATFLAAISLSVLSLGLANAHEFPQPAAEHAWLQQFVGEWDSETEATMTPGEPPVKSTGTESVRTLGGFWILGENKGRMMNQPFTGLMTLGYDPGKQKYIGTWVDSLTGTMWQYEGTLDATGKTLTLESEGVCPMNPGKLSRFKEVMHIEDADHRRFTSSILGENGRWIPMMTCRYQRRH